MVSNFFFPHSKSDYISSLPHSTSPRDLTRRDGWWFCTYLNTLWCRGSLGIWQGGGVVVGGGELMCTDSIKLCHQTAHIPTVGSPCVMWFVRFGSILFIPFAGRLPAHSNCATKRINLCCKMGSQHILFLMAHFGEISHLSLLDTLPFSAPI